MFDTLIAPASLTIQLVVGRIQLCSTDKQHRHYTQTDAINAVQFLNKHTTVQKQYVLDNRRSMRSGAGAYSPNSR